MKDAKELLEEVAAQPSLDKFFERVPPLTRAEAEAMYAKLRAERASWERGKSTKQENQDA